MRLHVRYPWITLCSQSHRLHITRIALQTLELLLNISSSSGNNLFIFIHQNHTLYCSSTFSISVLPLYKCLPLYTPALSEYGSHHIEMMTRLCTSVWESSLCTALYVCAPSTSPRMSLKCKNVCLCAGHLTTQSGPVHVWANLIPIQVCLIPSLHNIPVHGCNNGPPPAECHTPTQAHCYTDVSIGKCLWEWLPCNMK